MAYDVTASLAISLSAVAQRNWVIANTVNAFSDAHTQIFATGINDNQANLIWHDRITDSGGGTSFDLQALGDGFFADTGLTGTETIGFDVLKVVYLKHVSGGVFSFTNAPWWAAGNGGLPINGIVYALDPLTGWATAPAAAVTVSAGATPASFDILLIGESL